MVNKEIEENVVRAIFEKDKGMKVLKERKADLKSVEKSIKKQAYDAVREDATNEIFKYGMCFRRSVIFMIKQKYPELDLFDINLTLMHGYDIPYLANALEPIGDLNVERSSLKIVADHLGESKIW